MKIPTCIILILLITGTLTSAKAQITIPKDYFQSPLKIGLALTGSFSEVRPNHLHSGLDISVQGKEGQPVYAVADGVVSRIKVSPVGFGNALYIDHPNGFTSVYGHLQRYNDTISEYVHTNQYKLKSFDVDLFPAGKKEFIYVKKGQLIGYAGNSGSSGGAHLHFELRNTKTERVINPLLFGLPFSDNLLPYIDFIKIYPENENSYIGSDNNITRFNVKKTGSKQYSIATKDTLQLWGNCSFGVQAFDYNQSPGNRNGFYSMNMSEDGSDFFSMVCDSFSFAESRYVNATIDYASNYNSGNRIVKSKKTPGNHLSFIKTGSGNGTVDFKDNKLHEINITVGDVAGNNIDLKFWVRSKKPDAPVQATVSPSADSTMSFKFNKVNKFENSELKLELPAGCLYDDLIFRYRKAPGTRGLFSDIHYLHDAEVPLQSKMKVSVKASKLPTNLRSKALLVRIDRDGKRSPAGGSYENGYVTSTTNQFDGYAVTIDTVAPTIRPSAENSKSKSSLKFTVSDNFSGINIYRGEVNGKWALVEWDPKNKLMIYHFDQVAQPGKNTFSLYLEDEKGNNTTYKTSFVK